MELHPEPGRSPEAGGAELADAARAAGLAAGLDVVGVATAEPFEATRVHLESRRARKLHGGMAFTYRNPERSTTPSQILDGARSLVVGARSYAREAPPGPTPGRSATGSATAGSATAGSATAGSSTSGAACPTDGAGGAGHARVGAYAWHDHYADLRRGLEAAAEVLRGAGWRAVVVADDNALVDRAAAHRAGLGWYGRNTTILVPGRGSRLVLGSVVTDAPLPAAGTAVDDRCGPCRRCVDACPTGALRGGALDGRRCLAWLVQADGVFPAEHRVALGDRLYGCDDCQDVCPVNRPANEHRRPAESDAVPWVDVAQLLQATDAQLMDRHGRWYIPRRDPAYLRRNALVVLGNVADGSQPTVAALLTAALADDRPVVRAHAVWAARRLGRDDLLGPVAGDPDPLVRAEVARTSVPVRRPSRPLAPTP